MRDPFFQEVAFWEEIIRRFTFVGGLDTRLSVTPLIVGPRRSWYITLDVLWRRLNRRGLASSPVPRRLALSGQDNGGERSIALDPCV